MHADHARTSTSTRRVRACGPTARRSAAGSSCRRARQIDTSDMDYWKFPVGHEVLEGVHARRRADRDPLHREASPTSRHRRRASRGSTSRTSGTRPRRRHDRAVPTGVMNVNGTHRRHPDAGSTASSATRASRASTSCVRPHPRLRRAVQLDFDGEYDLDDPDRERTSLTAPPDRPPRARRASRPPGTQTDLAAYGYLHANCGHCHNPTSPTFPRRRPPMELAALRPSRSHDRRAYAHMRASS